MKNNPQKILIIQTAFLGDVILTTPLVKAVRELYPQAFISILLIPQTAEVFESNPRINQIILYDKKGKQKGVKDFFKLVKFIQKEKFDLALLPHRSFRSALLAYLSAIPQRIGFYTSPGSFLYTSEVTYRSNLHEIERVLSLLSPLGHDVHNIKPELFPKDEDLIWADKFLNECGIDKSKKIVGIAPSSVWATKRWMPEGYAYVGDRLISESNIEVLLLGSRADENLLLKISSLMNKKPVIPIGKLTLLKSAALIFRCSAVLSNDSAPVHMAVASGKPVVAIFGSTLPEFGFYPYGEGHTIIQKELYCRPCGIHGRKSCPEIHFRCMREISPDEVVQAVKKYL
ncbi:MAG: lipopolysaccharide heptosyltransferase II [candidate division Zixibacteria bacterium]|nr:lipopolysaccharide heptosyltransferase II [candidate division Zixibacteria bacterium]